MTFKTLQTAGSRIRSGQRRFFNRGRARARGRASIFFGGRGWWIVRLVNLIVLQKRSTTDDHEHDDEVDALPPWEFMGARHAESPGEVG
jgi:hypothetical protein